MSADLDADQPLTPAGERLLAAAAELFYRRGIRAVGVDLIAEVAGTTKKTLYDRFGSKDALVALYLRRRVQRWQAFVAGYVERTPPGRGQVLVVFDALEAWLAEQDRGCAFVNAHAEIGGTDHPGVPVIRAEKAATRALFTELVRGAGLDRAEAIAAQLHLLYEGANVAVTAGAQPDAIEHARAAAARLLDG
jgi:AcrR family transcriptional regulator